MTSIRRYRIALSKKLVRLRRDLDGFLLRLMIWPLVALIAIAGLWLLLELRSAEEKKVRIEAAVREAVSLASSYARQINRSIEKFDELSLVLKQEWETHPEQVDLAASRSKGMLTTAHFAALMILDSQGKLKTSTAESPSITNFSERDYYKFHLDEPSNRLRLGTPNIGKISKKQVIQVTRRLNRPDGEFDGVLVMGVANDFFEQLPGDAVFGKEMFQALIGNDDVLRVVMVGGTVINARPSAHSQSTACIQPKVPERVDGSCFSDGIARYVAMSALPEYPYRVAVGLSENQVLLPLRKKRVEYNQQFSIAAGLIALLGLIACAFSATLRLKRVEASQIRKAYRQATEAGNEGFFLGRPIRDNDGKVRDFRIVDCNQRAADMCALKKDVLIGSTLTDHYGDTPKRDEVVARYLEMYESDGGEQEYQTAEGSRIKADWVHRKFVRTADGLAVTIRDVSARVNQQREIERLAVEDDLTGLPNRRWLSSMLPDLLNRTKDANQTVAILLIDLDNFKDINDAYGHSEGDRLLKEVGQRITVLMRPSDHVIRFGGDEFVVVLENVGMQEQTTRIAKRLLESLAAPFFINGLEAVVDGASIGIAVFPHDGLDAETLLRNADIAMYAAKENKGQFCFYNNELSIRRLTRLATEQDLRRALADDQFIVYYQPRVDTHSGAVVGMEALVRWVHPVRGLIPPNDFIPIAENSDLIVRIGETVAHKVARQIQFWQANDLQVVPVSVNVSARQFNQGGVPLLMQRCLGETGITAELIEVEITESAMMGDHAQVNSQLIELNRMGITTHVDDFGTGYSSLAMLQRLSIDVLKIDRAFIVTLGQEPESEILYRAIISMAHALGMAVVAEGVETAQQREILGSLNCDEIQGYLIARPMPAGEVMKLLVRKLALNTNLTSTI